MASTLAREDPLNNPGASFSLEDVRFQEESAEGPRMYDHAASDARDRGDADEPTTSLFFKDILISNHMELQTNRFADQVVEAPESAYEQVDGDGISQPDLTITIPEYDKAGEGMNAHVVYKIMTKTVRQMFKYHTFHSFRRYKDFEWLHQQLTEKNPGVIIPPLPDKLMVDFTKRFSPDFVETRKRGLEKFLERVAGHPHLSKSFDLKSFLEANEQEWAMITSSNRPPLTTAIANAAGAVASRRPRDYLWLVKEVQSTFTSIAGKATNGQWKEQDAEFDEVKKYVQRMDAQLAEANRQSEKLIARLRELAVTMAEFGLSFILLGNSESEPLGHAMTNLGNCADRISMCYHQQVDRLAEHFDEQLKDYARIVASVKNVVAMRQQALTTWKTASADLDSKKQYLLKLTDGTKRRDERSIAAKRDVDQAQVIVQECNLEYDKLVQQMKSEMDRFQQQKLFDFKTILTSFVNIQIETCQHMDGEWRKVLPFIESIHTSTSSPPPVSTPSRPFQ